MGKSPCCAGVHGAEETRKPLTPSGIQGDMARMPDAKSRRVTI